MIIDHNLKSATMSQDNNMNGQQPKKVRISAKALSAKMKSKREV